MFHNVSNKQNYIYAADSSALSAPKANPWCNNNIVDLLFSNSENNLLKQTEKQKKALHKNVGISNLSIDSHKKINNVLNKSFNNNLEKNNEITLVPPQINNEEVKNIPEEINFNERINKNNFKRFNSITVSNTIENKEGLQLIKLKNVYSQILFSQSSISNESRSLDNQPIHINDFAKELFKGFNKKGAIDLVDNGDGTFTSIDNRRLLIAKKIVKINPEYEIYVKVHHYSDYLPGNQRGRFGSSQTWGDAVIHRLGHNGSTSLWGYKKFPKITTGKVGGEINKIELLVEGKLIKV